MKYVRPARELVLGLMLVHVALLFIGCGEKPVEKTADPAKVEESRKMHEEMSQKERGS